MSAPLSERLVPVPEPSTTPLRRRGNLRLVVSNPVVQFDAPSVEQPTVPISTPTSEQPVVAEELRPVIISPSRPRRASRIISAIAAFAALTGCAVEERSTAQLNEVYAAQAREREAYARGRADERRVAEGQRTTQPPATTTQAPDHHTPRHADPDPVPQPSQSEALNSPQISGFVSEVAGFLDQHRTRVKNDRSNYYYDNVTGNTAIIYSGRVDGKSGKGSQEFRSFRVTATENGAKVSCNLGSTQHSSDFLEQYELIKNENGGWDIITQRASELKYNGYGGYSIKLHDPVTVRDITAENNGYREMKRLFGLARDEARGTDTADDLVKRPYSVRGASC